MDASTSLLRLRSDDQLMTLFRYGNDDAFRVLHDRHRPRLVAYARRMLGDSADAEDLVQDVFLEAFRAVRGQARPVSLRAWLYRVAHNRCVDVLDRPSPAAADVLATSRPPAHDTSTEVERREDVRSLLSDLHRLTDSQRSVLLMREIDGMSYEELAAALDLTVPAVRSLLVRARLGLVETMAARDADCDEIRRELLEAYDRGGRASRAARRHLNECKSCASLRQRLFAVRRSLSALSPGAPTLAKLLGLGGLGGGATGGGASVGIGKVAAALCCTAALTGVAVETRQHGFSPHRNSGTQISKASLPADARNDASTTRSRDRSTPAAKRERRTVVDEQRAPAAATPASAASPARQTASDAPASAAARETTQTTQSPAAAPEPAATTPAVATTQVVSAVVTPVVEATAQTVAATTSAATGLVSPVVTGVTGGLLPPKK